MSIPRSPERLALALLLALLGASAGAADATHERATQLGRIALERAEVERATQADQAACAQQFALTACVDAVKAERRERLQGLARQRAVLDDEQRKRRAAERIAQIQQRQAARAAEQAAAPPPAGAASAARATPSVEREQSILAPAARVDTQPAVAAQAQARATARAQASARRASQAAAHRAVVEERNRERAALRPPVPPLPRPPDAAASR